MKKNVMISIGGIVILMMIGYLFVINQNVVFNVQVEYEPNREMANNEIDIVIEETAKDAINIVVNKEVQSVKVYTLKQDSVADEQLIYQKKDIHSNNEINIFTFLSMTEKTIRIEVESIYREKISIVPYYSTTSKTYEFEIDTMQ